MAFHCWVGERSVRHYFLPQIKITGHGPCHRRAVQPTLFTAFSCGLVSLWELLLGSVCSLSIMLRIVNAVLVNFGFGIYYTISIPFLAYGLGNCLANSLMVGVILCVFRNSNVMMEELERKTGIQTADIKRRETKTES